MNNALPRRPVIADVARFAGVSVPTVSRVLTGSVPVSEARRARVMAAIAELGFHPNAAARALVSGRRSMIGVIAPNTTRFGYARTMQGVEEAAQAAGYVVVIVVVGVRGTGGDPGCHRAPARSGRGRDRRHRVRPGRGGCREGAARGRYQRWWRDRRGSGTARHQADVIYNEFFWATVLLQSGDKFPITSSLNNLKGQFFTDYNLLSAGSVLVALPTLIVFFALQKQFVSGLTLGSTKG